MNDVTATERLARACIEVADVSMRVAYVRHSLAALPAPESADVLELARRSARQGDERARLLFSAVAMALAPSVASPLRDALADAARARGHRDLWRVLAREVTEALEHPVPEHGTGRPLTLGERKSLARKRDRLLLTRVLADPHPDVIRLLLDNPRIVEADVVRLAARRPQVAEVARELAGSARWMVRYPVMLALVKNPGTPRDVALPLLLLLRRTDLDEVAALPDLSMALREHARSLLEPAALA